MEGRSTISAASHRPKESGSESVRPTGAPILLSGCHVCLGLLPAPESEDQKAA